MPPKSYMLIIIFIEDNYVTYAGFRNFSSLFPILKQESFAVVRNKH